MPYETITLDVTDGVARITLDRPDAANALDLQMCRDLLAVSIDCDRDPSIRCIVLSGGEGRFFCAGGDLQSFAAAGDRGPHLVSEMTAGLHAAISRLSRGDAPVIAEVAGVAAGAGFSLVCASDLVIASEDARFTMAYTKAGLSPDGSSSFFLTRLVGLRRAMDLAITNRVLTAAEAADWGLINRVVPAADLRETVNTLAGEIAAGPTRAFGRTKNLLLDGSSGTLETQMERESRFIADSIATDDAREGLDAFLSKRKPEFKGR